MVRSRYARVVANVALVVLLASAGIAEARAQGDDDLAALNKQIVQLYGQAKYAEATALAQRALAIAERLVAPTTPMSPPASTTSPRCIAPRAAMPRPSRSTSAPWPSARRRWGPTTPMSASLNNLAALYYAPGPLCRGRAAL